MVKWAVLAIVALSVATLIFMVLRLKLQAFVALLVVALGTGLALGGRPADVIDAVIAGTGSALGFVALVIGLGAMLGGLLEASGGVEALAQRLLRITGERRAPWALAIIGIVVGIPLFFDVGFIILAPIIIGLAVKARRRAVYYALPVLAGLMSMHALLPPHPGPVAVAGLLDTDFGLLALYGLACGIPAAILAGPVFARRFATILPEGEEIAAPTFDGGAAPIARIAFGPALAAMLIPLGLIVGAAIGNYTMAEGPLKSIIGFIGHPLVALIFACLFAATWLALKERVALPEIGDVMTRALAPAGLMVLVVGAGAAYKQVLVDSGAGDEITALVAAANVSVLVFAFVLAAFIRVAQGSATVAMVTAGGLAAPLVISAGLSADRIALVTVAIGAGASIASHVNDTGFWLVKQYLGLTEAETFRSWTVSATIAGVTMFAVAAAIWPFV